MNDHNSPYIPHPVINDDGLEEWVPMRDIYPICNVCKIRYHRMLHPEEIVPENDPYYIPEAEDGNACTDCIWKMFDDTSV
jgi:hypothetical protein